MSAEAADSAAWVDRRLAPDRAKAALRTRDRQVVLLLTDTSVVLQFTDRGLAEVARAREGEQDRELSRRILSGMLGGGLAELLDHGIAYRLSALRAARSEGGRLVLEDLEGNGVFATVEVNGRHVMDEFAPAEAERFAHVVDRAIRAQR